MIKASIEVQGGTLEAIRETLRDSPRDLKLFMNQEILPWLNAEVNSRFKYPTRKRVKYPFASAASRRAFFARLRDEGLLRRGRKTYPRQGILGRSWRSKLGVVGTSVLTTVSNTAPGAIFTIGEYQTPGHQRTGWKNLEEELADLSIQADQRILDWWFSRL